MILPIEAYARYTIPIPQEVPHRNRGEFILRQLEKRHPCFEQQYKADIRIQGWGKKRMACATVVSDEMLLSTLAKQRHGTWLFVTEPEFHRVFRKGPVTCVYKKLRGLYLGIAAAILSVLLIVGKVPVVKQDENQMGFGEGFMDMEDVYLSEEEIQEEQEGCDEEWFEVEQNLELAVQNENAALWQVPEDGYLVGTIFDVEGKKIVFFRNGQGKLEIKELPSDKEKSR